MRINLLAKMKAILLAILVATTAQAVTPDSIPALISHATPCVVVDGTGSADGAIVEGTWRAGIWSGVVRNSSDHPVAIKEIVLFEGNHGVDPNTPVYGESFQMLAQIVGSLKCPGDLGNYPDRRHYRIQEPEGYRTASGLFCLLPDAGPAVALAFTSCNKFIGRIGFNDSRLKVYFDTENLSLPPHAEWKLESFGCFTGKSRDAVLQRVAAGLQTNHPRSLPKQPPTGWCSWYTFYEDITVPDIQRNLAFAKAHLPQLRYIQIDDGYQSKMGDWLETGTAFGGNIRQVLREIKQAGFEPAIWLAPFIAEKSSHVFQEHPDWFVKGPDGKPLDSSKIGFGGWRCAPWYVLDGTNPEVQKQFERIFRTMREEWGVTYFKLDANYWGAIHGGAHHDPQATRIEAYRRGMAALQKGAGAAFILGCNAPIWPSVGLVDGMRTSNDIAHAWSDFKSCGLENLSRGWQNGKLWWNDPDCVLLTGNPQRNILRNQPPRDPSLSEKEFKFHVAIIRAVGGLVLSGDELPKIAPERLKVLEKLLAGSGTAMHFEDAGYGVGRAVRADGIEEIALFNWEDAPIRRSIPVPPGSSVTDFWSGELVPARGSRADLAVPARSAVLLELKSGKK